MSDKRVDGYIFWLAEYLSRKFQWSEQKITLETAIKDANNSFADVYPITQHSDDIATFNAIAKGDNYRRMVFFKFFYGKEHIDLESDEALIYCGVNGYDYIFSVAEFVNGAPPGYIKYGKYIFSDADEAIFGKIQKADKLIHKAYDETLKLLGKPGDKERILEMVKNEELSVSEAQRSAFFIKISDCLKPRQEPLCITASPEEGKVFLPELAADLRQDTDIIVSRFKKMIIDVKIMASQAHQGDSINVAIGNDDHPHYSFEEHVLATIKGGHTSYQPGSDQARATGLWLWDYVNEHGGSVSAAVREARKHPLIWHRPQFRMRMDMRYNSAYLDLFKITKGGRAVRPGVQKIAATGAPRCPVSPVSDISLWWRMRGFVRPGANVGRRGSGLPSMPK